MFRFPRRAVAEISCPERTALAPGSGAGSARSRADTKVLFEPCADYPYPFAGYRYLPGDTADRTEPRMVNALRWRRRLPPSCERCTRHPCPARSRRQGTKLDEPTCRGGWRCSGNGLSGPTVRWRPAGSKAVVSLSLPEECVALRRRFSRAARVHGDVYARQLLLDSAGRLAAVIDWGDMHRGDPALDLSIAYSFLPHEARPVFYENYGNIDEDARNRARFRASELRCYTGGVRLRDR